MGPEPVEVKSDGSPAELAGFAVAVVSGSQPRSSRSLVAQALLVILRTGLVGRPSRMLRFAPHPFGSSTPAPAVQLRGLARKRATNGACAPSTVRTTLIKRQHGLRLRWGRHIQSFGLAPSGLDVPPRRTGRTGRIPRPAGIRRWI